MRFLSILLFLFYAGTGSAQNNVQKEKFHFQLGQQDTAGGYAQVIKTGNVIYVSGTVALNITEADLKRVYKVIEKSLEHYGASLQNVIKETIFTTDIEAMKQLNTVRKQIYKGDYPSSTWVQVVRLFMRDAKLEIEVVAYLPEK
ncbi:MAG: RidA family protein [Lacibacter sp.]|jgi:enamine deaminase RidA (YjgF/YER057c/UK114 family)